MSRSRFGYVFLVPVTILIVVLNWATLPYSLTHPDNAALVIYLVVAAALLNLVEVRLERGRLTLGGLAVGAAAILLNPLDATLVGLATIAGLGKRGRWPLLAIGLIYAAIEVVGASAAAVARQSGPLILSWRVFVLLLINLAMIVLISSALSVRTGEGVLSIIGRNLAPPFLLALGYLSLGALLISYVLNGSSLGYFLGSIVCLLALALTDTMSGRRARQILESELSDADRHLFHSRAVEGVVHNLRNHLANAAGYLKEIDRRRLDPVDRDALATAAASVDDAVTTLRTLSQGATPRVTFAAEPVDLNEIVSRALGMARPRARTKQVQLGIRESPEEVHVKGDPLLLREVVTNLVNNAIDAVDTNGHVDLATGKRSNGWPYFSVADDGPGVTDENRHHLFEPHFTTKEGGTGLGLFMSYGIIREHQGQLLYEGSRRGAVFTVTLPPFSG